MAFAIVHFAVGFVCSLLVLSVIPITRYRITGAYLGGIWGLLPDAEKILDGNFGDRVDGIHQSSAADVFFFHSTLDQPFFRENNIEMTFFSILLLGVSLLVLDWRFGQLPPVVSLFGSSADDDTNRQS